MSNTRNKKNQTPFLIAIQCGGGRDAVERLVHHGANKYSMLKGNDDKTSNISSSSVLNLKSV